MLLAPDLGRAVDTSFSWLGRFPLAVDLADTVRLVGSNEVDLLPDESALARWVDIVQQRFPVARAARARLTGVWDLRDSVRAVLYAAVEDRPAPPSARAALNAASALSPGYPVLDADGALRYEHVGEDPFDRFRAEVARSAIEVVTGPPGQDLELCKSPGCGMLFVRSDRRQRWCSHACGNRARVARHAARQRSGAS